MPAFYLTLLAVLLSGIGARDQMAVAELSARQSGRPAILILALLTGALSCAAAVWAAMWMLQTLPPPARAIFAAIALGLAGLESLVLKVRPNWKEPTLSLGALGLVLLAHQITDAARFLVVGLGVGMAAPYASGAAGILGGGILTVFAWRLPEQVRRRELAFVRRGAGLLLLLVALYLLFSQMHIL